MNYIPVDKKLKVAQYVEKKFENIERKFTKQPYINHLYGVAELAHSFDIYYGYEIGLLHDLYEDTDTKPHETIEFLHSIGYSKIDASFISDVVFNLTKTYTGKQWKKFDSVKLTQLETERILHSNEITQSIKYCDIIDNIKSNIQYDKIMQDKFNYRIFLKKYLPLKKLQLDMMDKGNQKLRNIAYKHLNKNYKYFKL